MKLTLLRHPQLDGHPTLAAGTRPSTAAAAHLGRRRDRDRHVGFEDVAAMPDPEWSRPEAALPSFCPGRFEPEALVPTSHLRMVPLADPANRQLAELTADILAAVAVLPLHLRHQDWFAMRLAPIAAELDSPAPDTSWGVHVEQAPEVAL